MSICILEHTHKLMHTNIKNHAHPLVSRRSSSYTNPYTHTAPDATFRDLLLAIRKDEATHREVNHTFASMNENDDNPFLAEEQYRAQVEMQGNSTTMTSEKGKNKKE